MRLRFHTSRPESFAIYKRTYEGGPWVPYQYYSGSCEKTYQKVNRGFIRTGDDEQQALCTDEFSDISPLTGGNVAFSTLEGRPSSHNFDNSPVLQVSRAPPSDSPGQSGDAGRSWQSWWIFVGLVLSSSSLSEEDHMQNLIKTDKKNRMWNHTLPLPPQAQKRRGGS